MTTDFVQFAIDCEVLRFGEFTLKSGRTSPYFFNAGLFNTGARLHRLAGYYADALVASGAEFDQLFGPAYKGIPLASNTAAALYERHGMDVPYLYNRKEAKDHGEGGLLVGAEPEGRIMIIDDVITAGTAIREALDLIEKTPAEVAGVTVVIDRQEKGKGDLSAIQEVEQEYGLSVVSIVKLDDILEFMAADPGLQGHRAQIEEYRERYGISN